MKIQNNISLKPYNTFGIECNAKRFVEVNTIEELKKIVKQEKDIFLLGGGSNMLLTSDINKLVVHLNLKGKRVEDFNNNEVLVTAQAGENWHEFVIWCIENNYGGLENLSLIPGNVGTSPIQNIGAYGVEIKDVFYKLEALCIETGEIETFLLQDCDFGYRNSVFKNSLKGKYIILNVTFKLTKQNHILNTEYGAIKNLIENIKSLTIKDVSNAVISIRSSKLPNPEEIGNSGSFFKNPVIEKYQFEKLQKNYPEIPHYKVSENEIKVPAGWLIEKAGFKGKRFGDAGVHNKQALVLVNYNNASGKDILKLAKKIQQTIKEKFDINLEMEVNII